LPNHPALRRISLSIPSNLDPDSNVTEESDLQFEKQPSPQTSTDEGRMSSTKAVPENAHRPIRDNFDSDSNLTEESDLQLEKQLTTKDATDAGTKIPIKPVLLISIVTIPTHTKTEHL
jgi:hypothetical protein